MTGRGSRTKDKLAEARFFLDQLAPNYGRLRKFDYFLSAFISSARSVTWVMRSEFHDVPGWEDWYKSKKPVEKEASLLKGTNSLRIRTEKLGPVTTASTFRIEGLQIPKEDAERFASVMRKARSENKPLAVKMSGKGHETVLELEFEGERFQYPATEVFVSRRVDEFPEQDVLDVCKEYFVALERLVGECHVQFGA